MGKVGKAEGFVEGSCVALKSLGAFDILVDGLSDVSGTSLGLDESAKDGSADGKSLRYEG